MVLRTSPWPPDMKRMSGMRFWMVESREVLAGFELFEVECGKFAEYKKCQKNCSTVEKTVE